MKFSFSIIQKLAPGKYDKATLVEKLNFHSFEAVDLGGDILEIAISPNRYSDASSHLGIAREVATIFNLKLNDPTSKLFKPDSKENGVFNVNIKDRKLCSRYMATYATNVKVGPSPKWLRDALESCGLRSINNVVDIMNYVMLEIGQPLHAFDADKISGGIIVRTAKKGESLETIDGNPRTQRAEQSSYDGNKLNLPPEILVIADMNGPLAIAGIKGGKPSEVTGKTRHILVEAANFDGGNIYRSSRILGLATDASARFSHQLSPELVSLAIWRTLQLLKELAGAKLYSPIDVYPKKQSKKVIKWNLKEINNLVGSDFSEKDALKTLQYLGFRKSGSSLEIPPLRRDIENIEDIAEEVARFRGYNNLVPVPPRVALASAEQEDQITLKDRMRTFLVSVGISEVYNYSFLSSKEISGQGVELRNPISSQSQFLRDSLKPHLIRNLEDNSRYFNEVRVFELGKVFNIQNGVQNEKLMLGIAILSKESHLELKGLVDSLLGGIGVTEYIAAEKNGNRLEFTVDGKLVGYLALASQPRGASVVELDLGELLKVTAEEREYKPLPKFPSITRDLSIFVPEDVRVGLILETIQRVSTKLVDDVDLIDFYEPTSQLQTKRDRSADSGKRRKSLTFRIVFRAEDRTLTDAEADREMAIINQVLINKFDAELR